MATKPRILVLGGGASLGAALAAALAEHAEIAVVADMAPPAPHQPAPLDINLAFEPREPRPAHSGYGPPPRGRKGKPLRWRTAA